MFQEMTDRTIFSQAKNHAFDYLDRVFDRHVFPKELDLEKLKYFEEELPERSTPTTDLLQMLHENGSPNTTAQIGGRYFGFVNGGIVPAALAVKWLSDFWDQNTAMQVISPISAKLETVVERWLTQLFNLPSQTVAGFVSGTSSATFCGLAAARFRLLKKQGWDLNEKGLFGAPRLRIVSGRQTHSTVLKAVSLLGFGTDHIEWVDVDDQGSIIPEKMPALDERTIVLLQAGNVNSGSFDPFEKIGRQANAAGAWIHIDGAFGLWAATVRQLNDLTRGIELAHSWSVDGHKTLNTPYDSGIVLCADQEALVSALHLSGAYIILGEERDGMFFTPEMSRRARIVELWATLKFLGKEGIDEMILGLHQRAKQFAHELRAAGFQILNKVVFNQVLVYCESDQKTEQILRAVQTLRVCWCGGSRWKGKSVIRISVCSWATRPEDVALSVASFAKARQMVEQALV
ncbi:MAG: aminotransferase class V-fold PLP-dependent enzyme [Bacteroidota bacterium]